MPFLTAAPAAAFGGRWLRAAGQLALVLSSGLVPQARNLILNPLHPAITTVKFGFTGSPSSKLVRGSRQQRKLVLL